MGEITTCEEVGYAPSCADSRQREGAVARAGMFGGGGHARAQLVSHSSNEIRAAIASVFSLVGSCVKRRRDDAHRSWAAHSCRSSHSRRRRRHRFEVKADRGRGHWYHSVMHTRRYALEIL